MVFEDLYSDHRIKELKKKMLLEDIDEVPKKTLNHAQLTQFLDRNQKFQEKVNKKKEIMNKTSKHYDLKSGVKLFSPKINEEQLNMRNRNNTKSSKTPS